MRKDRLSQVRSNFSTRKRVWLISRARFSRGRCLRTRNQLRTSKVRILLSTQHSTKPFGQVQMEGRRLTSDLIMWAPRGLRATRKDSLSSWTWASLRGKTHRYSTTLWQSAKRRGRYRCNKWLHLRFKYTMLLRQLRRWRVCMGITHDTLTFQMPWRARFQVTTVGERLRQISKRGRWGKTKKTQLFKGRQELLSFHQGRMKLWPVRTTLLRPRRETARISGSRMVESYFQLKECTHRLLFPSSREAEGSPSFPRTTKSTVKRARSRHPWSVLLITQSTSRVQLTTQKLWQGRPWACRRHSVALHSQSRDRGSR